MVKKASRRAPVKATTARRRKKRPEINDEEEEILRAATIYLLWHHGHLLVATGLREEPGNGSARRWIITVTLRYPVGHEGYVGDLLYDGQTFTFLTEKAVMDERVRQIANDPERMRKWNEYRASTLPAGKR